jgi:hypothetical protein
MRNATIITCNSAGVISAGMVWHDETDENEVIQLTIGEYEYDFDNEGKLLNTKGVQSCHAPSTHMSCAQPRLEGTCIPINIKTED